MPLMQNDLSRMMGFAASISEFDIDKAEEPLRNLLQNESNQVTIINCVNISEPDDHIGTDQLLKMAYSTGDDDDDDKKKKRTMGDYFLVQ